MAIFAVLYALFMLVHIRLPYVQSGAALVTGMKHDLARVGQPFKKSDDLHGHLRIMAFGHSKMLAGLIPSLFDSRLAAAGILSVESYNFGLPGEFRFVEDLEIMAARGVAPDVALLMIPWPEAPDPGPTFFHFVNHDQDIVDRAFPFRKFPRDLFIMAAEARGSPGAMRRIYLESERTVNQVVVDRGYYFIARQSHYPNDEMPAEFTAPTDTPGTPFTRSIPPGPMFDRLARLCAEHHITCLYVPSYFREGQFAAAPQVNSGAAAVLAGHQGFGLVGPDYFLYPNRLFSDPIHVNPRGAEVYTRAVAALVAGWLAEHPTAAEKNPR